MLPNLKPAVAKMSEMFHQYPWDNKLAYAEYLAQTYYYVAHSTRLLALAAARFSQEDQGMHKRFLKHTGEENSHELLAQNDLKHLGHDLNSFPELSQTRILYEVQYYKIEHCDPIALMGYILTLEMTAGNDFKWLKEKVTGLYGKECARFIQVHADDDPDHIERALKLVEHVKGGRLELIDQNIEQTAICFTNMLEAAWLKRLHGRKVIAA